MGRQDILNHYKKEAADEYKILEIGILGSIARGEANDESDVDIVIRVSEPDFFILAGIKNDLEDRLNKSVDIVTYNDSMNAFLKKRIESRGCVCVIKNERYYHPSLCRYKP